MSKNKTIKIKPIISVSSNLDSEALISVVKRTINHNHILESEEKMGVTRSCNIEIDMRSIPTRELIYELKMRGLSGEVDTVLAKRMIEKLFPKSKDKDYRSI